MSGILKTRWSWSSVWLFSYPITILSLHVQPHLAVTRLGDLGAIFFRLL